ncbi:methyltransferase [Flammeovirga kamogawensis]|uniref:Methyltransferase n=1 Tax=Flammeovirga kamogawensis TaxID=373891 RepID=A0ABX8H3R2_9BACT|nr:methyltransferase [Flammeovirga kamogawensis]MBB6460154.1 hypothetical protein [Flammeovirga kamogawensis]QWG09967.1 methyltransferase [Flammeovirga kamogawensis]TRX65474.1 methyltransferase [Flammeovirga kamogawensis]
MESEIKINKPTPIGSDIQFTSFTENSPISATIEALQNGKYVLVEEAYKDGMDLLHEIQAKLKKQYAGDSFKEQRAYRKEYRDLSHRVLIRIKDHKLAVKKAPSIGWLEKLYAETPDFILSFPEIQGLNSAWQWNKKGLVVPVLRNKLHPYYGTYFPTRFDHLVLFDNWLKRYEGPKKAAYDIGVGSGVLSMQMVKHGFQKVFATDTNPNAIVGLKEFMGTTKLSRKIELDYGSLFGKWEKPHELIVFNPPWLPIKSDADKNDTAIYYPDNLFPDFFKDAVSHLSEDGQLVIIFSNLAEIAETTTEHPIQKEIDEGGRFTLELKLTKSVKKASDKTKRTINLRESEKVELWVLKHK